MRIESFRHHQIEKNHARRSAGLPKSIDRFDPIRGRDGAKVLELKAALQALPNRGIILHDENVFRIHPNVMLCAPTRMLVD